MMSFEWNKAIAADNGGNIITHHSLPLNYPLTCSSLFLLLGLITSFPQRGSLRLVRTAQAPTRRAKSGPTTCMKR